MAALGPVFVAQRKGGAVKPRKACPVRWGLPVRTYKPLSFVPMKPEAVAVRVLLGLKDQAKGGCSPLSLGSWGQGENKPGREFHPQNLQGEEAPVEEGGVYPLQWVRAGA